MSDDQDAFPEHPQDHVMDSRDDHEHEHQQEQQEQQEQQQQQQSELPSYPKKTCPGKIFIGGLSPETTEDDLKEYFGTFGEIQACTVMRDRNTGVSKNFAFLTFVSRDSAKAVYAGAPHTVKERQVDCKPQVAKGPDGLPVMRQKKIFIGGITPNTDEDMLRNYFSQWGPVDSAKVMIDLNTQKKRGFAFVTYEDEDFVDFLFDDHKNPYHELDGKQVEVKRAGPNPAAGFGGPMGPRGPMMGAGPRGPRGGRGGYAGGYGDAGGGYGAPRPRGPRPAAQGSYDQSYGQGGYGRQGGYGGGRQQQQYSGYDDGYGGYGYDQSGYDQWGYGSGWSDGYSDGYDYSGYGGGYGSGGGRASTGGHSQGGGQQRYRPY